MATTTSSIAKYTVQVLNNRVGKAFATRIIVSLYDEDDNRCATILFKDSADEELDRPAGDFKTGRVTCHMDMKFYDAFIDILRLERQLYWKVNWVQTGATKEVSDVSLDTKKEIIGDYFPVQH
jgi:hypothetical protein